MDLDTVTPNFQTFLVRIEGSDWREMPGSFKWILHKGSNYLEAKARNKFGLDGPVSEVTITFSP